MISLEAAQQRVWSSVSVLSARLVSFAETAGLVLADDVVATENVPPFANTAVDGFALHSADVVVVPATLRVIGTVAAGDGTEWTLRRGEALRIMTGAPMPAGADAVVMVEECEVQGEQVIVRRGDRKSTRLNSSHVSESRMPSSA